MKSAKKLEIKLVRDEPATEDVLQSHAPLAEVIADTILHQPEIKVIGLLGRWGSGKSTVVRLVQKQLLAGGDRAHVHCFTFDAWLHQTDNPRRAFLERLLQFLIDEGISKSERWKDEIDQLSGRRQETETTTTPLLTWQGRLLAFFTLIVPLGFSFVGYNTFAAAYGTPPSTVALWVLRAGIVICLLPIVVVLTTYLALRPKLPPWKRPFWTTHRGDDTGILNFFYNRSVQKSHAKVLISPEPTAAEFQKAFRKLVSEVTKSSAKLVITIDNLDRLPATEALALWVAIRNLLLGESPSRMDEPTLLLPIDPTALGKMYAASDDSERTQLVQSFVEKTFDVTFNVARPVMSAWTGYMASKLREVFLVGLTQDDVYVAEKFVASHLDVDEIDVTPRHINAIINTIATNCLLWSRRHVPFSCICYYSVFYPHISQDIEKELYAPRVGIDAMEPSWQGYVAGMYFGTDSQTALQIVVAPKIRKSISERDERSFRELSTTPNFTRVLHNLVESEIQEFGALSSAQFILNLSHLLHSNLEESDAWISNTWSKICAVFDEFPSWQPFGPELVPALEAIIAHTSADRLGEILAEIVRRLEAAPPAVFGSESSAKAFFEVLALLQRQRTARGEEREQITVPGGSDEYLLALSRAGTVEIQKSLVSKADDATLVSTLVGYLADELRSASIESRLRALKSAGKSLQWQELVTASIKTIQGQNGSHHSVGAAACVLLLLQDQNAAAASAIKQLGQEGHLTARFNEVSPNKSVRVEARLLAMLLRSGVDFGVPTGQSWAQYIKERDGLSDGLTNWLGDYSTDDLVDIAAKNASSSALVSMLFERRVARRSLGALRIKSIIQHVDRYLALLSADARDDFIGQLAGYQNFWQRMDEAGFETSMFKILRSLRARDAESKRRVAARLKVGLTALSGEGWKSALRQGGDPYELALESASWKRLTLAAGESLSAVLADLIPEILSSSDTALRQRWFGGLALLSLPTRRIVVGRIRDQVLNGATVWNLSHLLASGDGVLAKEGSFEARGDDAIRNVILPLLADAIGLSWLEENSERARIWFDHGDNASRRAVEERIAQIIVSDETLRSSAERLKQVFT